MADLKTSGCEFTFINSDGNPGFETVVMKHNVTFIVTGIDRTDYVIYGKNQNTVTYGGSLTSGGFDLRDSFGNRVYIDSLKTGDVLSVFASKDNECIKMILSKDSVSGEVVAIDSVNHSVVLRYRSKDESYSVVPEYMADFTLGLKGDFCMDAFSRLVYTNAKPGESFEYGYFMNVDFSGGLNPARLKIYTPTGFEVYECSKTVFIDGIKTEIAASSASAIISGGK
ncbi:MAG: hypothetical protein J6B23_06965, partial [Clostridia bacterium]|nr:hypothetical protein [Clostridia bacterium]